MDLKNIVRGSANLTGVKAPGVAIYEITAVDSTKYLLEIDMTKKEDVGYAVFEAHYDVAMILMRWIRRAIENNTLIQIR